MKKLSDTIRVGEETGSLDSMLLATADAMEFDADIAINKMVSYVEPHESRTPDPFVHVDRKSVV